MAVSSTAPSIRLLLAADDSEHSKAATRWLASLAAAGLNVHCVIVNVQPPILSGEVGLVSPVAITAEAHERHAKAIVERAADGLRTVGIAVTLVYEAGEDAAATLLACAQSNACEALVLGRRGQGALRAALLGSVSTAVVRQANMPVILVNREVRPVACKPLRIVLATDGSDAAHRTATFAAHMAARAKGGEVHVLHVRPDLSAADYVRGPGENVVRQLSATNEARTMAHTREIIERAGGTCALFPVVAGQPDEVILRIAADADAGMIAMGTRGLTPIQGLLLGSVAQRVVQQACVPVLLAR